MSSFIVANSSRLFRLYTFRLKRNSNGDLDKINNSVFYYSTLFFILAPFIDER